MRALYTAATGMAAQELNVQVISNNIANLRTTGFKKQRAAFQDLIYGPCAPGRRAGVGPGHHPPRRRRHRRRRQDRRHAAADDAGHAVADRQRSRYRRPRRGLLQDPDARRHLHLHPRRLVPDGCHRPRRQRPGQSGAADHHHPEQCVRHHHQRAGPGFGDAAGLDDADHRRPDRPDPLHQQGRPAADRRQPVHGHPGLGRAAGPASPIPTAMATCSRAASSRPMSRWFRKSPT